MVVAALTDLQSRVDFFQGRILVNLKYWRDFVARNTTNTIALDTERNRIIKAIVFALDLKEAWPSVYELIITFSPYMERRGHWEIWGQLLDRAIKVAQHLEE